MSEFTRMVDLRQIGDAPLRLVATVEECAALAVRFGLVSIGRLEAEIGLEPEGGGVNATGRLSADVVQSCAVSGEDLPVVVDEAVRLRFVPEGAAPRPDEEVELSEGELDEVPFSGTQFDLGEELAQSLALAIDPYAEGPNADRARKDAGIIDASASGPFAALAALTQKD